MGVSSSQNWQKSGEGLFMFVGYTCNEMFYKNDWAAFLYIMLFQISIITIFPYFSGVTSEEGLLFNGEAM